MLEKNDISRAVGLREKLPVLWIVPPMFMWDVKRALPDRSWRMGEKNMREVATDNCVRSKAAARAWYEHGAGTSKRLCKLEAAAARRVPALRPSRFKTEAMLQLSTRRSLNSSTKASVSIDLDDSLDRINENPGWDCGSTLFDSFEIVSISKQLDDGLAPSTEKLPSVQGDVASPTLKTLRLINSQRRQLKNTKLHVPVLIRPLCQSFRIVSPRSAVDLAVHRRCQSTDSVSMDGEVNYSKHGHAQCKYKNCSRERPRHRLPRHRIWKALYYVTHLPHLGCRHREQQHQKHYHYHVHHNDKSTQSASEKPYLAITTAVSVQASSLLPAHGKGTDS
eukprot:c12662_g1_i1 orf=80-1084(-)